MEVAETEKLFDQFRDSYTETKCVAYNVIVRKKANKGYFILGNFNHIHPYYLIPNYLKQRNLSNSSIRTHIQKCLTSKKKAEELLDDDGWRTILIHYGYYIHLMLLNTEAGKNQHLCIGCNEHYNDFREFLSSSSIQPTFLILVECGYMSDGNSYDAEIFLQFARCFLTVKMLSIIHSTDIANKNCSIYQKNKKCEECTALDNIAELYLGYIMVFCREILYNVIQSRCVGSLTNLLSIVYDQIAYNVNNKTAIHLKMVSLAKLMKSWSIEDLASKGQTYAISSFRYYEKMATSNLKGFSFSTSHMRFHMYGKILSFVDLNICATGCFVLAVCTTNDLYEKVLSLKSLISSCYANKQYLIGIKSLKCTYKLCDGYILKLLTRKEYNEQKNKFLMKIKTMKCNNCNKSNCKLKSCSGCMVASYCSVSCQKLHWKATHRDNCEGSWGQGVYKIIKNTVFHRL